MTDSGRAFELPPLVMRCSAFGDMVLLTVLLQHLHARFGKPVDVIGSGSWTLPLLEGHPSVGRIFLVRSRRMPYWLSADQRNLVAALRERGAGPTWFCDRGVGRELLHRAGISNEYICDSTSFPWLPHEGFADRYIRLGGYTPAAFEGRLPKSPPGSSRSGSLWVTAEDRGVGESWLSTRGLGGQPYVIVHPGSRHLARRWLRSRAGASKYWPEARWGQVVEAIRDLRPDHAILLTGTSAERSLNADIAHSAGVQNVHNLAGQMTLRTLLAVLERAHSIISVDTGPAHAAAALGCPTVALFGTADPELYRPGGATTPAIALTGQVEGRQNILGISVESVVAAWTELVGTSEPRTGSSVNSGTRD